MNPQHNHLDPLFDADIVQDPHAYYADLREQDPVHELAGTGTFLVTSMALIHEAIGRTGDFSSLSTDFLHLGDWASPALRPSMSDGSAEGVGVLATADPPDHERHRRVVARKLSTSNMRAMEPEFRDLVNEALRRIGPDGRFDWMTEVAEPLPMVMVARILGLDDSLAPDLKRQGYAMLERIGGFVPEGRILPLESDGTIGLTPVIEAYAQAKEDSSAYPGGLLAVLARAVNDGELDDLEALATLSIIIAVGGESTTSLTGTAVRLLAEQEDLQDRLRTNPTLIPNFVEEALRFDPPFRGHYRIVTKDTQLGGKHLPAGSRLVLSWPAANRDLATYDCPNEVFLDRPTPRNHVGFGWGIHLCVGAPLARIEARVAIEALLTRTRVFRVDPDAPPLRYHPSLMVRRLVALPLMLESSDVQ